MKSVLDVLTWWVCHWGLSSAGQNIRQSLISSLVAAAVMVYAEQAAVKPSTLAGKYAWGAELSSARPPTASGIYLESVHAVTLIILQ